MTDGRFSAGSHGFVLDTLPEAAVGGPIGLLRRGTASASEPPSARSECSCRRRSCGAGGGGLGAGEATRSRGDRTSTPHLVRAAASRGAVTEPI